MSLEELVGDQWDVVVFIEPGENQFVSNLHWMLIIFGMAVVGAEELLKSFFSTRASCEAAV